MFRRTALGLAMLLCAAMPACAQTVIYPPINQPVFRAFDANGAPLAGGKLYTYAAGSSTPLATYADGLGAAPNANPVILDSTGQAKIFLAFANYKFVLKDANDVQQWSVDNISGIPQATGVTSFNTRTGDVVAITGDYTCAQVTGAICALPTIYYQTVQAGGVAQTQRSTLNLIAGTNIGIACVDNSGADSTDCTVTNTYATGTATTCNANGCYKIDPDGTITQWGTSAASGTGHSATVAVTFPIAFNSTPQSVIVTANNCPNPALCSNSAQSNIVANKISSTVSVTGFTIYFGASVVVGGGGSDITTGVTADWIAISN